MIGIDLDIEEYVELSKIENLIKLIKKDFGPDFIISMAPVQYAIETDNPGGRVCLQNSLQKLWRINRLFQRTMLRKLYFISL